MGGMVEVVFLGGMVELEVMLVLGVMAVTRVVTLV